MKERIKKSHNYLSTHRFWKYPYSLIVVTAGILVVLAGIVMLIIPGPGLFTILIGTAILSTQFKWAKKLLDFANKQWSKLKLRAIQLWKQNSARKNVELSTLQ